MKRFMRTVTVILGVFFCLFSMASGALEFEALLSAPTPASGATGLAVKALPDGRLLVWNGGTIYREVLPRADGFEPIATGYVGDPGFMALSPDGHTVLLAAGYSRKLYLLDLNDPHPYSASSEIAPTGYPDSLSQYAGVFLNDSLVLIDSGSMASPATSDLGVFDVQNPAGGYRSVMVKPASLASGDNAYSARLAIDPALTSVYAMSYVLDLSWNSTTQLKRISADTLIGAYQAQTTLSWDSDATAIGATNAFFSTGPTDVVLNGDVLVSGTGGVQRVDPTAQTVIDTYVPLTDPLDPWHYSYLSAYNGVTGDTLLVITDWHTYTTQIFAPVDAFEPMPACGATGLAALIGTLVLTGRRKLR